LPSGAILDITPLPYEEAWEDVAQIILKEFEGIDLGFLKMGNSEEFAEFLKKDINVLKTPACRILASKSILGAAKKCFVRCTYNGKRIDNMTFESKDARGDFLTAAFQALRENVSPFFGNLISLLAEDSGPKGTGPSQK
jgi:hypothetical protein